MSYQQCLYALFQGDLNPGSPVLQVLLGPDPPRLHYLSALGVTPKFQVSLHNSPTLLYRNQKKYTFVSCVVIVLLVALWTLLQIVEEPEIVEFTRSARRARAGKYKYPTPRPDFPLREHKCYLEYECGM